MIDLNKESIKPNCMRRLHVQLQYHPSPFVCKKEICEISKENILKM